MKGNLKEGLTYKEAISGGGKAKLRGETNLKTQRPVAKTESMKGDGGRGSFKSRC